MKTFSPVVLAQFQEAQQLACALMLQEGLQQQHLLPAMDQVGSFPVINTQRKAMQLMEMGPCIPHVVLFWPVVQAQQDPRLSSIAESGLGVAAICWSGSQPVCAI